MAILPDQLEARVELIAYLCSQYGNIGTKDEWWGDYRMPTRS